MDKPDSYKMNQLRLRGNSTNLYDANLLDHYIHSAKRDREDRERLKEEVMGEVYKALGKIEESKKYTRLPESHIVIRDCQNIIYGMPVQEMRDLLVRMKAKNIKYPRIVKMVLEYA